MTFGYLAQPIDQGRRSPRITRVIAAAKELAHDAGIDLYQPGKAFQIVGSDMPASTASAIDAINRQGLDLADVLVAVLPYGVATLGTPVEIERALGAGLPTIIVTEDLLFRSSVQVRAWSDAGAFVATLEAYESDPLGMGAACREMLVRRAPVATERPRDLLPYVRADILSTVPTKAYEDDAGLDLAASADAVIPAGGRTLVPTGLKFALPTGTWGLILGRSSTWAKRELVVMPGVIDAGWRGELFVSLWNPGTEDAKIEIGERLAQYILLPAWAGRLQQVEELPAHARGENGFGSSGR